MTKHALKTGLLWFDDTTRDLAEKVLTAAQRYRQKFGAPPNLCLVHPSTLSNGKVQKVGKVRVAPHRSVLPNHFWIGVEEKRGG